MLRSYALRRYRSASSCCPLVALALHRMRSVSSHPMARACLAHGGLDLRCALPTHPWHRDLAHPCHICTATRFAPCHICSATRLAPCHICTGTGLTTATSAPRLGSPCHICTATRLLAGTQRPPGLRWLSRASLCFECALALTMAHWWALRRTYCQRASKSNRPGRLLRLGCHTLYVFHSRTHSILLAFAVLA